MCDAERGRVLLPIARAAISCALGVPRAADESAPWLSEPGACFVTLTQHGGLRGCIGSLQAHRSLLADVKGNAVAAALRDPRFPPLSRAELDITEIEISLLSATQAMAFQNEADALAQLRPGIDGVVFEYSPAGALPAYRSTYLPQVWERFPQPRQFLASLKNKAGLPGDFWAEGVKLSRYIVTKWKEPEPASQAGVCGS
ncbi:MAG: AmmeMemoRadiSam system protein A [Nitrosomonadales bacterium]|nr:AmmeMemoRadiSam system protein A [Nitrosomonadales bacterium]